MTTPAVAYYRMSTARQETSIAEQKEWAPRACRRHGVEVLKDFEDPGIAGSEIEQRPGLMALVSYCEERARAGRPVECVVCWDPDRFSRADSFRTAAVISRLMDAGVTRMLCNEGWVDWTNDIDRVLANLRQDLARSAFSKGLSRNIARSQADRARQGLWLGGIPPYAYILENGRLAPGDPRKVEAVRWMFRAYLEPGMTLGRLIQYLTAHGYPAPRGGKWSYFSVRAILQNRRYLGDMVWNVTHIGKFHRVRGGEVEATGDLAARQAQRRRRGKKSLDRQHNAAEDVIVSKDTHPALVDRETFERVQEKLAQNFRKGTTPVLGGGPWALSGILHCGDCGARMWGQPAKARYGEKVYFYRKYWCSTNRTLGRKACYQNSVHQADILKEVVKLVQEKLGNPRSLELLRAELARAVSARSEDLAKRRRALEDQVGHLGRQIEQGNENLALLPADRLAGVVAKVRQWEEEREKARRQLAELDQAEESGQDKGDRIGQALGALEHLHELIERANPAEVRAALRAMVSKVTLHFQHLDKPIRRRQVTVLDSLEVELTPEFSAIVGYGEAHLGTLGDRAIPGKRALSSGLPVRSVKTSRTCSKPFRRRKCELRP
jgi:DNA invertase Pin-like site-specific DNA recombinase